MPPPPRPASVESHISASFLRRLHLTSPSPSSVQRSLGGSYNILDDIDEQDLIDKVDALEADMGTEAKSNVVIRPTGAAVFMQRNKNLKMCLRTTDTKVDTSQIAKEYGGGGKPNASSFVIRMDEYNYWT